MPSIAESAQGSGGHSSRPSTTTCDRPPTQTVPSASMETSSRASWPISRPWPPWRNGTTHVEFEPIDFVAKLAALVPPPRAHLTRFHGIFAPNANLRAQLTPAGRGRRPAIDAESTTTPTDDRTPAEHRSSMTWAQRLKRVFDIDVSACIHCGGAVRIVANIEEPKAIRAILAHFEKHDALEAAHYRPAPRGPPAVAV